jgi:hypothetical protein
MPQQLLPIRQCWDEWNRLVPIANAMGIRVRTRAYTRTSREEANARLDWLRSQIGPRALMAGSDQFDLPTAVMAQTFGVEFEVILPRGHTHSSFASALIEGGLDARVELYNHTTRTWWKVTTDGSLGSYAHGVELVSPILMGEDGFEQMRKACAVMASIGCKVTKRCGFHVHVGARARQAQFFANLLNLYATYDRAIDSVVAPSRRNNLYCRPVIAPIRRTIERFEDLPQDAQRQRFRKLNLTAYHRHGTVEFRQHQGTIESRKAEAWVRLCLRMTDWAANVVESADPFDLLASAPTLDRLIELVGVDEIDARFFRERAAYFAEAEARAAARRNSDMRRAA